MKSGGTADVHGCIAVMHAMKSPQEWQSMTGQMPHPCPEIQQQKGAAEPHPFREWLQVQECPRILMRQFAGSHNENTGKRQYHKAIQDSQTVVACCVYQSRGDW